MPEACKRLFAGGFNPQNLRVEAHKFAQAVSIIFEFSEGDA